MHPLLNTLLTMNNRNIQLLHLLRLASQALPVGAYAYSQGLESAVSMSYVESEEQTQHWISGVMSTGPGQLDLPILIRQYRAWSANNMSEVYKWNEMLAAFRETSELLFEDQQMGRALYRILETERREGKACWESEELPSFVTIFALAGVIYEIDLEMLIRGFAWSWMENQVNIATKLIPLGQSAAQRILVQLIPLVDSVCQSALSIEDNDIGCSMQGLSILSSNHEHQATRLFRS